MYVMAGCTGDFGIVFGVGLGQYLIDLRVTFVFMTVAAVFLRGVVSVFDDHWFVRTGVTAHAHLWLNANQVVRFAAFLAVAAQATRDKAVLGVAVGAGHGRVLAGELSQLLGRATVAVRALIMLNARQGERGMGIGMAVAAGLGVFFVAVGVAVAVGTFGQGVGVLNLAGGVGVIDLVTEGAFLLMPIAGCLEGVEHANVALSALLHGERLNVLVEERRTGRNLLDLVGQVDLAGPGVDCGTHGEQCPGKQAAEAKVTTYNMCCLFHFSPLLVVVLTIKKYRVSRNGQRMNR